MAALPRHFTRSIFSVVCVLLLAAAPALAQDITKVAPTGIKVVFENDQVRVLDVVTQPGSTMAVHSHPAMMIVTLTPGTTRFTSTTGKTETFGANATRGAGAYRPAESHASENVGKAALHSILIEFKQPAPAADKARHPSLPAPYKQVVENAHAVQFELVVPPGGSVPAHTHGNHVLVALADATVEITNQDGTKQTINQVKDTAEYGTPVTHSGVNTGKTTLHIIVVELK